MAKGADLLGKAWADVRGIPVKKFPAEWDRYGMSAGPIRNKQMAEYGDALIVLIWANSHGSLSMLKTMSKEGKPTFVVHDGVLP